MHVIFYVVDESALSVARMQDAAVAGPQAVIDAIIEHARAGSEMAVEPEDYATVFHLLDRTVASGDFLVDLAFAGSPYLVLTGHPGRWRLGYFEASLIQHLQPALNALADSIADDIEALPASARSVYLFMRQAIDEAFLSNAAVAIIHTSKGKMDPTAGITAVA